MKIAILIAALIAGVCAQARPAHAISACTNNLGIAPRRGTELPPRAHVLAFHDRTDDRTFGARINGRVVPVKVTAIRSAPYDMHLIEIDSDRTGTLKIFYTVDKQEYELASYKVRRGVALPKDIAGTTSRFTQDIRHSSVREKYDALAIHLGGVAHAIYARIKIRRDAQAQWQDLAVPVNPGDWMDKQPVVRIGKLGCSQNYGVGLLEGGVDLEVEVALVDGTTRKVALPAHVRLPKSP